MKYEYCYPSNSRRQSAWLHRNLQIVSYKQARYISRKCAPESSRTSHSTADRESMSKIDSWNYSATFRLQSCHVTIFVSVQAYKVMHDDNDSPSDILRKVGVLQGSKAPLCKHLCQECFLEGVCVMMKRYCCLYCFWWHNLSLQRLTTWDSSLPPEVRRMPCASPQETQILRLEQKANPGRFPGECHLLPEIGDTNFVWFQWGKFCVKWEGYIASSVGVIFETDEALHVLKDRIVRILTLAGRKSSFFPSSEWIQQ